MDKGSFCRTHDTTPPPKKRRLHPPEFESSFHVMNPPSKASRRTMTIQSIPTTAHDFTLVSEKQGRERHQTPHLVLDNYAPELYTDSDNVNSPAHHTDSRRRKRISASFSEFTPTFDMPPPQSTSKPRSPLPVCKVSRYPHQIFSPDLLRTKTVETGSVVLNTMGPRTPMHLLNPLLKETVESPNRSLSKKLSSPSRRAPHLLGIASIADADQSKFKSMTSHLTSLSGAVSHLASPHCIASEVDRKHLPIVPPTLAPETPKGLKEAATTATYPTSHAERAEILANSVRLSRTYQFTNVEFGELSRGLELSPQKGGRAQSKKLVRGGLAERAEHLFFRCNANFSLWQAGFAKQLEGDKHTKEDIRLRISSILSHTKNTTRSFSEGLPRTTIAKCTKVFQGAPEGNESSTQEEIVVFLFASHERVSSAMNFQEGKEVCIWRPWQEIELPDESDRLALPTLKVRAPSTPGQSVTDRRTALLCSRFLVLV